MPLGLYSNDLARGLGGCPALAPVVGLVLETIGFVARRSLATSRLPPRAAPMIPITSPHSVRQCGTPPGGLQVLIIIFYATIGCMRCAILHEKGSVPQSGQES